jgi:tRNA (guanine26-N2/guanine27-N2)-dimethyltransferase
MEHFSYVDIDPFGTPVPFIQSGIRSVLNNGYMGVTATDTAALTGSIPRVARRRYGVDVRMTHAYQEMACRTLMGHIARTAAAFERGVEPVLFYSSDHFVRGYVKLSKGAKKADASLGNVGWIKVSMPSPPDEVFTSFDGVDMKDGAIMGPIWTGDLEDPQILNGILEMLEDEERWGYLPSYFATRKMVERALSESGLPILGYDVNELSSSLKVSPPSMETIFENLGHLGRRVSRSRFSPTIFKTDAELDEIRPIFISEGG